MKNYLSLLFILIYWSSFSQKKEFDFQKKYSVNQVFEDIDYTEKYITKFHPDPFKYISKDSLHAFVVNLKSKIDSPLTEMQTRFYIKRIISQIGCGHTDVGASKKYTKAITKLNRPILPLNIFITDSSQVIVLNNLSTDTTIKAGDEILSIDKHSTKHILNTIYSIYPADGYNQTHKKQGIRYLWFKYYYSFCYGFKLEYSVKIKHQDNTIIKHKLTAVSSLKDTLILPEKKLDNCLRKTKTCSYSIIENSKPIAIIDINAFKGWRWHKFFRKSFKDIKQKNISNLVIDLRDNGGGQVAYGMNFLSYLIHKPTTLSFDRKPNLLPLNFRFKMDIFSRVTPLLLCFRFQSIPKHGRLRHYIFTFPKKRNAFKGQVYVLTNGKTFSMSSVASSYLKYKSNAIVVGEETGGNIAGSNAIISGNFVLPHTKIRVYVPVYHIYHDVAVNNTGRGLLPDYHTHYTKEQVLNGEDIDLKKVLELVK